MDFFREEDMDQQFYLLNGTRTSIGNNIEDPQTGERFGNFGDFEWNEYERAAELLDVDDFYDWAEDWAYDAYGDYTAEDYFRETYGEPYCAKYSPIAEFARSWGLDARAAASYIVNELGEGYEWCESIMG